jgi:hypothetical protein
MGKIIILSVEKKRRDNKYTNSLLKHSFEGRKAAVGVGVIIGESVSGIFLRLRLVKQIH